MVRTNLYNGRDVDELPSMLGRGLVPLAVFQFMRDRDAIVKQHGDIYADTSDLVDYAKKRSDKLKVILNVDSQGKLTGPGRRALELINSSRERISGAIALSDEEHDSFNPSNHPGVIPISRKKVKGYGLSNPVWRALLRHPDYVPAEFALSKELVYEIERKNLQRVREKGLNNGLGVYLANAEKVPTLRAWCVKWLGFRSIAYGGDCLDDAVGCFVEAAPEAQNVSEIVDANRK